MNALLELIRSNPLLVVLIGVAIWYFSRDTAPTDDDEDRKPLSPLSPLNAPATHVPTRAEASAAVDTLAKAYRARGWPEEKVQAFIREHLANII